MGAICAAAFYSLDPPGFTGPIYSDNADWYSLKVEGCTHDDLLAVLAQSRDEEKEYASMVLEWIRRKDPTFDKKLMDYLFTEKPIAHE